MHAPAFLSATSPGPGARRTGARLQVAAALGLAFLGALSLPACSARAPEPVRVSREALDTIVTVTAYGDDRAAIERALNDALGAMTESEKQLSAYPDEAANPKRPNRLRTREVESVIEFNRDPFEWHIPPPKVVNVLDRIKALGVQEYFSPSMLRVMGLYDFGGEGAVPDDTELKRLVRAARAFETTVTSAGVETRFADIGVLVAPPHPPSSSFAPPAVGLDLSGAAKGDALDAALRALEKSAARGVLKGALISAGSTTLVSGQKQTAENAARWRVGIEDPRDPEKIIGVVEYTLMAETSKPGGGEPFGTVSTSGDYQQSFVRDSVRYHHILDPATGKPARGMRSLTVVGATSALDSDILSTALFVMGIERAETYAREHGLGLFIVDARGRTRIVPGPEGAAYRIAVSEE